jgi:hypothetical protein
MDIGLKELGEFDVAVEEVILKAKALRAAISKHPVTDDSIKGVPGQIDAYVKKLQEDRNALLQGGMLDRIAYVLRGIK